MQHFRPWRLFLIALLISNAFSKLIHATYCSTLNSDLLVSSTLTWIQIHKNQFTFVSYSIRKRPINHLINIRWKTGHKPNISPALGCMFAKTNSSFFIFERSLVDAFKAQSSPHMMMKDITRTRCCTG